MTTFSIRLEYGETFIFHRVSQIIRKLKTPFVWLRYQEKVRRDLKQLSSLSDHELQDIGISRYDIERVVRYGG